MFFNLRWNANNTDANLNKKQKKKPLSQKGEEEKLLY